MEANSVRTLKRQEWLDLHSGTTLNHPECKDSIVSTFLNRTCRLRNTWPSVARQCPKLTPLRLHTPQPETTLHIFFKKEFPLFPIFVYSESWKFISLILGRWIPFSFSLLVNITIIIFFRFTESPFLKHHLPNKSKADFRVHTLVNGSAWGSLWSFLFLGSDQQSLLLASAPYNLAYAKVSGKA